MISCRHATALAVFASFLVVLIGATPATAQVRNSCGTPPGPLPAITNDILDECKVADLTGLMDQYSAAARYFFCQSDLARRERDENYDDTTWKLVNAEIDAAQAAIKAAKAAYGKNKANPNAYAGVFKDLTSAADNLGSAAQTAAKGADASAISDEFHRKGMNALHQANNAGKLIDQMKAKNEAGEDCPPSDEDPFDPFDPENEITEEEAFGDDEEAGEDPDDPFAPENEISREEAFGEEKRDDEEVVGTYSGFGITVDVLARGAMRITSDCKDDNHRIQIQGLIDGDSRGTWQAVGVGVSQVIVAPPQTRDYQVRRRCGNEYSGAVMVPFKTHKK